MDNDEVGEKKKKKHEHEECKKENGWKDKAEKRGSRTLGLRGKPRRRTKRREKEGKKEKDLLLQCSVLKRIVQGPNFAGFLFP